MTTHRQPQPKRWWNRFWAGDPDRTARRQAAHRLYCDLVNQSRLSAFYAGLGVPDTPEGRFEMIGLHVALLVRRLRDNGSAGAALAQELFDLMFADLDANLRELGVGDLSVGKQVKRLARNFYARLRTLDEVMGGSDLKALKRMLRINVYHGGETPSETQVAALSAYLVALERHLAKVPAGGLLEGRLSFPAPPLL